MRSSFPVGTWAEVHGTTSLLARAHLTGSQPKSQKHIVRPSAQDSAVAGDEVEHSVDERSGTYLDGTMRRIESHKIRPSAAAYARSWPSVVPANTTPGMANGAADWALKQGVQIVVPGFAPLFARKGHAAAGHRPSARNSCDRRRGVAFGKGHHGSRALTRANCEEPDYTT